MIKSTEKYELLCQGDSRLLKINNNMKYSTELANGDMLSSFFSDEGFVAKFIGPGEIWIQTRKPILVSNNG